mmetsp:Transcript_23393/g.41582  ORF Transcript_23393/g.41582 Transcript_23393/m.41582 type:complete len:235 (-) Transcript_23393:176-880(-)
MTLIRHRASVHFSCKKKKICFASQNYLKNDELSKIPSSNTSPALVRLKKIRFISKLLHVSVLASIGSLTVFASPAFARKQIVLSDKKTLVNAYEHVAGLSLVAFRGSVPQSWIASFRTALGSHCGFNMDIRPKLIDIFEELSGGDLAPHVRLCSSGPSPILHSQVSLTPPSVPSPSPSPSSSSSRGWREAGKIHADADADACAVLGVVHACPRRPCRGGCGESGEGGGRGMRAN